jgi:hypothetical protein
MSDEIDREITTKRVTSNNPYTSVDGYKVSQQRTTNVSNDNSATGLILGILLALALGVGAALYYLNNRTAPAQILVPGATNTIRENKSTVIERNNTSTQEVKPATPPTDIKISVPAPAAPKVQVNVPAAPPKVEIINIPAPAATTPPQTPTPVPTTSPAPTPEVP